MSRYALILSQADEQRQLRVEWRWPGGGLANVVDPRLLLKIVDYWRATLRLLRSGEPIWRELEAIGRELGAALVPSAGAERLASAFEAPGLKEWAVVCEVPGHRDLPFALTILPDGYLPAIFTGLHPARSEFVHVWPAANATTRWNEVTKLLGVLGSDHDGSRRVEHELEEVQRRLTGRDGIRVRISRDPDPSTLRARLRLECTILFYAGDGRLTDIGYEMQIGSGFVQVQELLPDLQRSEVDLLIFDSCDSGLVGKGNGLPLVFRAIETARCLIAVQGPANATISSYFFPLVVERIILGYSAVACLSQMREVLFELHSDCWALPTVHLKKTYAPLEPFSRHRTLVELLE